MTEPEPEAQDKRLWAKISLDYFDNPKIDALSDDAQLLHLSLILRAKRQRVGGHLSIRSCKARGEAAFKELINGQLLEKVDPRTYKLHDYEKHQTDTAEARAAAGKRGGHTKNHVNRHIYDELCESCQEDFNRGKDWLKNPELVLKTA